MRALAASQTRKAAANTCGKIFRAPFLLPAIRLALLHHAPVSGIKRGIASPPGIGRADPVLHAAGIPQRLLIISGHTFWFEMVISAISTVNHRDPGGLVLLSATAKMPARGPPLTCEDAC